MQRRDFIAMIASSAVSWPQPATAQQAERVRRIGMLLSASPDDTEFHTWSGVFLQTLALSGWTIGKNIRVDTRWARSNAGHRDLIVKLVARHKLPAVYYERLFAAGGGLAAYGPDYSENYRRRRATSIAFSTARSRPIFRCRHRTHSN
jgi:hypothetical protein